MVEIQLILLNSREKPQETHLLKIYFENSEFSKRHHISIKIRIVWALVEIEARIWSNSTSGSYYHQKSPKSPAWWSQGLLPHCRPNHRPSDTLTLIQSKLTKMDVDVLDSPQSDPNVLRALISQAKEPISDSRMLEISVKLAPGNLFSRLPFLFIGPRFVV